uniref:ELMO domain-containing protein n=2 Tax=Lotharella globosa TaxID=91324 RepID=A0A7S3YGJ3_9EUKA
MFLGVLGIAPPTGAGFLSPIDCCLGQKPNKGPQWTVERKYIEFATPKELKLIEKIRSQTSELFDIENEAHRDLLVRLWKAAIPEEEVPDLDKPHEKWKYIGFQNARPETDFRAAGILGLRHLVCFAEHHTKLLRRILAEQRYPWAAASINVTEIYVTHLKLRVPQPRIAPIPMESIYDLQAFTWLAAGAARAHRDQKSNEWIALDLLHSLGVMMLDHLWNQRLEEDRTTNLLHFKMALMETSAVINVILRRRPDNLKALRSAFMDRLPPAYDDGKGIGTEDVKEQPSMQ